MWVSLWVCSLVRCFVSGIVFVVGMSMLGMLLGIERLIVVLIVGIMWVLFGMVVFFRLCVDFFVFVVLVVIFLVCGEIMVLVIFLDRMLRYSMVIMMRMLGKKVVY